MSLREKRLIRKKYQSDSLINLSLNELMNKKSDLEKCLKQNFFELLKYVEKNDGPFFQELNKIFSELEREHKKCIEDIILINDYLPMNYQINLSIYDSLYKKLKDNIEKKNFIYIKNECEKIKSEKNWDGKKSFGIYEPWTVPIVKYHGPIY